MMLDGRPVRAEVLSNGSEFCGHRGRCGAAIGLVECVGFIGLHDSRVECVASDWIDREGTRGTRGYGRKPGNPAPRQA